MSTKLLKKTLSSLTSAATSSAPGSEQKKPSKLGKLIAKKQVLKAKKAELKAKQASNIAEKNLAFFKATTKQSNGLAKELMQQVRTGCIRA